MSVRSFIPLACLALLASCREPESTPPQPPPKLVLWAWERPEDLRFAGAEADVAVQTGFVDIVGEGMRARGRRFPLKVARPPSTVVVHVQIDPLRIPRWTPRLRGEVAATVLHYATVVPAERVQIDFEVRESERQMLLDLLADVRRGLPRGRLLSMTALASWCDTEDWLSAAPVDEIVPMLFRMREGGERLKNRLAQGGDFRNPRCRAALGVSTDSPIARAPPGRRVYLFSPRSWREADYRAARRMVEAWR